jgi:trehalose synthase
VVGKNTLEELALLASNLKGRTIQSISSAFTEGAGETINLVVLLLRQLEVDARWDVFRGNEAFSQVTRKFRNALHGQIQDITPAEFDLYHQVTRQNLEEMELYGDIFFIHGIQPAGLIQKRAKLGRKWIWRSYTDISEPDREMWKFLRSFVIQYDAAVFSAPAFSPELPIRQFLISPSIDPLSEKNKELSKEVIDGVFIKYSVPRDKPVIIQVSRFEALKDPVGVIQAFELVHKSLDCRLVLAGGTATADPESAKVLAEIKERAGNNPDIHILLLPPDGGLEINALQRGSAVILQQSLSKGFGLSVSEALWKSKPVVASAVGGIPLQVKDKLTGLLTFGIEDTAYALRQLLSNPAYARWLGNNGKEHVRHNYLITRNLKEHLMLFLTLDHKEAVINMLNARSRHF